MENFNHKIGGWLFEAQRFFDQKEIQEQIFDLPHRMDNEMLDDEHIALLKELSVRFLKLSFIIRNNTEKSDSLIKYLTD